MRDVSVVFVFASCPPSELLELRRFGYRLASTADCQGVEKVDNVEAYVRHKFTVVVGSKDWPRDRNCIIGIGTALQVLNVLYIVRLYSGDKSVGYI